MNGAGNCKVRITAAIIHKVNEKPFNDSLKWVDRAMSATPRTPVIPAHEEAEKRRLISSKPAPEIEKMLKLFFIVLKI